MTIIMIWRKIEKIILIMNKNILEKQIMKTIISKIIKLTNKILIITMKIIIILIYHSIKNHSKKVIMIQILI
jgi:hypothetical protein